MYAMATILKMSINHLGVLPYLIIPTLTTMVPLQEVIPAHRSHLRATPDCTTERTTYGFTSHERDGLMKQESLPHLCSQSLQLCPRASMECRLSASEEGEATRLGARIACELELVYAVPA